MSFPDGEKYVGQWKGSKYNGKGTLILSSGEKHVGEFKDGKLNGHVTIKYAGKSKGDKYVGQFKNGTFNGKGTYTFYYGAEIQKGIFKNGKLIK